jgi:hypothetical protein
MRVPAESSSTPSPAVAFWGSIGIFVIAVIAVALLWSLVGAWVALIVLAVAFCALFGIAIYAIRFYRDEVSRASN